MWSRGNEQEAKQNGLSDTDVRGKLFVSELTPLEGHPRCKRSIEVYKNLIIFTHLGKNRKKLPPKCKSRTWIALHRLFIGLSIELPSINLCPPFTCHTPANVSHVPMIPLHDAHTLSLLTALIWTSSASLRANETNPPGYLWMRHPCYICRPEDYKVR